MTATTALNIWAAWVGIIAGVMTIFALGYAGVKWARKQLKDAVAEDVQPMIEAAIKPILTELHPNSGTSMRDAITRLEKSASTTAAWRRDVDKKLDKIVKGTE